MKYAMVDLDHTLVPVNTGVLFGRELLRIGAVPPLFVLRNLPAALVTLLLLPFSFLLPVYMYLQKIGSRMYFHFVQEVGEERVKAAARRVARRVVFPEESVEFLKALHEHGYDILIVSATPDVLLEELCKKLPVPVRAVGTGYAPVPMTPEMKAEAVRKITGDTVHIVVGNPGRDPFFIAKEHAVVVRSPEDLKKWKDKLFS